MQNITGQLIKSKIPLEKYENVWKDLTLTDDVPDKETKVKLVVLIGNDYYDDSEKKIELTLDYILLVQPWDGCFLDEFLVRVKMRLTIMFVQEEVDVSRA